jgi:D-tyrosyl-tRNA(Tyr) deacylase
MRAVIQRVKEASVTVEGRETGRIGVGFLVLLGVEQGDGKADLDYICGKIAGLRVFTDAADKMNLSLADVGGAVLLVSQFTLCGDARHGRRPSFTDAAPPEAANAYYEQAVERLRGMGLPVETGQFQADMQVALVNDGPVTILLDSRKRF